MRWIDTQVNRMLRLLQQVLPTPSVTAFVQRHKRYVPAKAVGKNAEYGTFYAPYYNVTLPFSGTPNYYSADGRKLDGFFQRDVVSAHIPYSASKYFFWDRFNYSLPTHFYAHGAMLETMGRPDRRYGMFVESEGIIPEHYAIFRRFAGIEKDFDAVFTFSETLLNTLPNAKFFLFPAVIWYSKEECNGEKDPAEMSDLAWQKKEKDVSMLCSARKLTPMQLVRHRFANDAARSGKVDVFGTFSKKGGGVKFKSMTLEKYRFQIVVENDIRPFYFTEKIMDCFASMTIPVYLGAPKIGDFFNADGIITIQKDTPVESIIRQCTESEYIRRLDAVRDNYKRSLKYLNMDDRFYEEFFM